MVTIGERIDFLRKKHKMTLTDLASAIGGITGDGIRKAITKNSVSKFHIELLSEKLGWDKEWILSGGDINKIEKVEYLKNLVLKKKESHFKAIPYYNINVSAGNVSFLDNGLIKNQDPDDFFFIPDSVDADVAFPTYGHSMFPEICNGDKVAYKFIKDWSFFNYGMKYLVVTDEQRMVKYMKKSSKENHVLLTSRNEEYEDIEMPVSSIRALLQVRYIGRIEM